MDRKDVAKEVLGVVGVSEDRLDLLEKILSLREDEGRVHKVELFFGVLGYRTFSADVHLKKNFIDEWDFRNYLEDRGLSTEMPEKRAFEGDGEFRYRNGSFHAKFFVPDYFL